MVDGYPKTWRSRALHTLQILHILHALHTAACVPTHASCAGTASPAHTYVFLRRGVQYGTDRVVC